MSSRFIVFAEVEHFSLWKVENGLVHTFILIYTYIVDSVHSNLYRAHRITLCVTIYNIDRNLRKAKGLNRMMLCFVDVLVIWVLFIFLFSIFVVDVDILNEHKKQYMQLYALMVFGGQIDDSLSFFYFVKKKEIRTLNLTFQYRFYFLCWSVSIPLRIPFI